MVDIKNALCSNRVMQDQHAHYQTIASNIARRRIARTLRQKSDLAALLSLLLLIIGIGAGTG